MSESKRACFLLSFLIMTLILLDLGPTFMTSFNFNYLLKALPPNTVTSGLGLQHKNWGGAGDKIQSVATSCILNQFQKVLISIIQTRKLAQKGSVNCARS